ncbi:hypothetical protein DCS_02611 [Drechmeria coniospora]|uniref:Homeobox domain-containing protein n=1 Tax=Drechmeria coniospora TaxID=98403 RepID=A0A151GWI6_DRECN|nr:hypothetical protein DCS_02611 [Drechmeria coniospora]KYK61469.1 hypothetical protein DCS_02611 [Drechmeria coniospora]ODA81231.1 hypothetical protein RJ55_04195 [Drechmeria coniospora]
MSDRYDLPHPVQPDWQGQYSYLPQHETGIFSKTFGDNRGCTKNNSRRTYIAGQGGQSWVEDRAKTEQTCREPRGTDDQPILKKERSHAPEEPQHSCAEEKPAIVDRGDSLIPADPFSKQSASNHFRTVLSREEASGTRSTQNGADTKEGSMGEDGDFDGEDDEVAEGDGDVPGRPLTMAERLAARRKMKRFRLTHQQTRFLMSEFAKQPHPDAAHRERLSREIPGLSPRQVQVWFQNRRAKIKRLTADDRDRMMRMRTVPDDFDNVQALHSPYGAVQTIVCPAASGESMNSSYGNDVPRPLMIDVRREEDAYLSPTGLTPSFGGIELGQSTGMESSGMLSPLSSASHDRYVAQSRTVHAHAGHQGSLESIANAGRAGFRQRQQPMHLRESISRSRTDSIQSPLRTSLSWKPDSLEYPMYQGENNASPSMSERHQTSFQTKQLVTTMGSAVGGCESQNYSSGSNQPVVSGLGYIQIEQPSQGRSRARASSASLPLNIDFGFRGTYRPAGSGLTPSPPSGESRTQGAALLSKQDDTSGYSVGHPPTPLSAPLSQTSLRTFNSSRLGPTDFSAPQMSAPITAPSDFGRVLTGGMTNQPSSATKRYFGDGPMGYSPG